MHPDRYVGLKCGEVGLLASGRYVLITNQICTLPHKTTAEYLEAHRDAGCLMRPWEGIVFEMVGDTVSDWGMRELTDGPITAVPPEKAEDIKRQMADQLERMRRQKKAENFRGKSRGK